MKKVIIIVHCLLAVILMQCNSGRTESTFMSDDKTTVTTSENETTYTLEASFHEDKATAIYEYINVSIEPDAQFDFENGNVDTQATLNDGTTFHIIADRTELKITFDKEENSSRSYQRMKQLYEGVQKSAK